MLYKGKRLILKHLQGVRLIKSDAFFRDIIDIFGWQNPYNLLIY